MSHLQQTRNTQERLESSLAGAGHAGHAELQPLRLLGHFIQFLQPLSTGVKWEKQNSSNIHAPGSQGGDSSTKPPGEQSQPGLGKGSATKLSFPFCCPAGKARALPGRSRAGALKPKIKKTKLAGASEILGQDCWNTAAKKQMQRVLLEKQKPGKAKAAAAELHLREG